MFIAGDWGTTQARLYLCDGASIVDCAAGPGVGVANIPPEQVFQPPAARWVARHGRLAAHLCGMVGSRNGWVETPYVQCPADANALRAKVVKFEAAGVDVSIVPGLVCTNPLGAPDVMRGEETQILGALAVAGASAGQKRLLALPGTHTKWVVAEGAAIRQFLTSPTGELFSLIRDHSILGRAGNDRATDDGDYGFMRGVARQAESGPHTLMHLLFETRSRQLIEGISKSEAMSFLSGLLIGADVAGALQWFGRADEVILIGEPTLNDLYEKALSYYDVKAISRDGEECALAGLRAIFQIDPGRGTRHAAV